MNVNDMTAQQAADWCANNQWTLYAEGMWVPKAKGRMSRVHPFPLTLDGANAALPVGVAGVVIEWKFDWHNGEYCAKAYSPRGWGRSFALWIDAFGPDELTARYRLAVACRMAAKEQA
jgi:hypothetical protein